LSTVTWEWEPVQLSKKDAGRQYAGVVQVVERLLAKEKVVGSSPIARSGSRQMADGKWFTQSDLPSAKLIPGDVAKW
jgi:hypothetical protein